MIRSPGKKIFQLSKASLIFSNLFLKRQLFVNFVNAQCSIFVNSFERKSNGSFRIPYAQKTIEHLLVIFSGTIAV